MSDLPDLAEIRRLVNQYGEVWDRAIIEAFQRGVLKSRDEMDIELAVSTLAVAMRWEYTPEAAAEIVVAAAWGVTE